VSVVTGGALAVAAFVAMEGVSYLAHRFVMHGAGMVWHRSHHVPTGSRFERNDLFPLCFSTVGVSLFALATTRPSIAPLLWVGVGVTAYGATYLVVHEVYIHRRLPVRVPALAYLEWLRAAHRVHHRFGGEPYGMLLPLVPRRPAPAGVGRAADGRPAVPPSPRRPGPQHPRRPECGCSAAPPRTAG
jgi:beta-carotene 3-hydroxylase